MTTAQHYREKAKALYKASLANADRSEALVQIMQANEFELRADKLERGQADE